MITDIYSNETKSANPKFRGDLFTRSRRKINRVKGKFPRKIFSRHDDDRSNSLIEE